MESYKNLLRDVMAVGVLKASRGVLRSTGAPVRTLSVCGRQWRHDLADGFPLLTTKQVFWRGVVEELLWFLRGSTNVRELQERGVHIWDEWADSNGNVGPIYGWNWRHWGARPPNRPQPKPKLREGIQATYLGVANGSGSSTHDLGKMWEGMIARCYDSNSVSYPLYGRRGVYVCDRWLEFAAFAEDAINLPGWSLAAASDRPREYVLDKDGLGDGFTYGPDSCQWITQKSNSQLAHNRSVHVVQRISDNKLFVFANASDFCEEHGFTAKNFSDLWTGTKNAKIRNGFKHIKTINRDDGIDQIARVVHLLRTDPDSRRMVVSAWDPATVHLTALPPCHFMFQFAVQPDLRSGTPRLCCHMNMRSTDAFLGLPFNIASYALLTHLLAHVTGHPVGELVVSFGDLHIYEHHIPAVAEQLTREPRELPTLRIDSSVTEVDELRFEHLTLEGYNPHPKIAAEVSV